MLGLFNLKIVFKDEYEKLVEDWEVQNKSIDTQAALINRQGKRIGEYIKELEATEQRIADMKNTYEKEIEKFTTKYLATEDKRRTAAGKNGGYVKQIHKLEAQINDLEEQVKKLEETNEFLKKHRRAPNIEEIKDYELRRLRNKKAS